MTRFKKLEKLRTNLRVEANEIRIGIKYITFGKVNGGKFVDFYFNDNDKKEFAFKFTDDENARKITKAGHIVFVYPDRGPMGELGINLKEFLGTGVHTYKTDKEGFNVIKKK